MGKDHEKLLNNLQQLRKAAHLTQQELSEAAEVSRKSINAIENAELADIAPATEAAATAMAIAPEDRRSQQLAQRAGQLETLIAALNNGRQRLQTNELAAAKAYFENVGMDKPMFEKISIYLAKGFAGHPSLKLPITNPGRIYEWRTYEAYNEDALKRKIAMFNDEELKIFDTVGLHNVFFGEVLAGENTPCLSYMVSFENMAERDANWVKFQANPDWKRISADPKYANSHSRTVRKFLEPTSYSQW